MNADKKPLLFEKFPSLEEKIPWLPLVDAPTPVQRMETLGRELGAENFWIKRDDLSARPYGGNKPRKLEFVLAHAKESGADAILTFGGIGTNHGLATAIYARDAGLATYLLLVPQPVNEYVKRNLLLHRKFGAVMRLAGSYPHVAAKALAWIARERLSGRKVYLLPPGGSSVRGVLGHVNAGLEIAEQVAAGEMPKPDFVFTAAGTAGTAAGLLAGFALAGLGTTVVAVRVTDRLMVNQYVIRYLANSALGLLRKSGLRDAGRPVRRRDFILIDDYFGGGYGKETAKGLKAIGRAREAEGIKLEPTYTGKAMAAALDFIGERGGRGEAFMFENTYNSSDLSEHLEGACPDDLPGEFHKFFVPIHGKKLLGKTPFCKRGGFPNPFPENSCPVGL